MSSLSHAPPILLLGAWALLGALPAPLGAQAEPSEGEPEVMDFSAYITPTCELLGLTAKPPADWFSVPIREMPEGMAGCQMMRTDDDDGLVGILRLRSTATAGEPDEASRDQMIGSELAILGEMGYEIGEPLWSRSEVPIQGAGFSHAQAVGLAAEVAESGLAQEIHLLVFRGPAVQYLIALLTPSEESEPEVHRRNTDDMGVLIRSLNAPTAVGE